MIRFHLYPITINASHNRFGNIDRLKAGSRACRPGGISSIHAGRGMARPMD